MDYLFTQLRWPLLVVALLGVTWVLVALIRWLRRLLTASSPEEHPSKALTKLRQRQAHMERKLERLHSVLRLSAELNADLNYTRVLNLALKLAAAALATAGPEDHRLVGALMLLDDDMLCIAASRGLSQLDQRMKLPGKAGVLAEALQYAERRYCGQPRRDPELRRLTGLVKCDSAICIPLAFRYEVYGVLLFGHQEPHFFNEERLELLDPIAQQAVTALQNARLYNDLEQDKERITQIQEEARKKLARDLHDGPAQSVGAITMRVNFARRLLQRNPEGAAQELFRIESLARRTTKEIRQMLFTLRPLILESKGLVAALEHLTKEERDTYGQNVILDADPEAAQGIEIGKQNVVFFVAEESIANARKHAKARQIWVRVWRDGDLLTLEVEDDGIGFSLSDLEDNYEDRGSLGMVNLRERAELVNGLLRIDSVPGRGTHVMLTVPLTTEAADRLNEPGFVA